MHLPSFRGDTGIPRDNRNASLHGFFQGGNQRVLVVGRYGDSIDLLCDQRVDDFDLSFSGGVCRPGIDNFHIAEFSGGFLGTLGSCFEKANAQCLDDQGYAHIFRLCARPCHGAG